MADSASDLLSKVRALAGHSGEHAADLRRVLVELREAIRDAVGDVPCSGESQDVWFSEWRLYPSRGHFAFYRGQLSVEYRDLNDDFQDDNDPDSERASHRRHTLDECPASWLVNLSREDVVRSLLLSIEKSLSDHVSSCVNAVQTVKVVSRAPLIEIGRATEDATQRVGYSAVLEHWKRAQSVEIDPEDAITHARSLLESTCKHVLLTLGSEAPTTSVPPESLLKSIRAALDVDDEPWLSTLLSGAGVIARGVTEIRNARSSAHGHGPTASKPTATVARLVVNVAGTVSTFLMELVAERGHAPAHRKKNPERAD